MLKRILRRLTVSTLAIVIAVGVQTQVALACPTCKSAISGHGDHGIQLGFYWSILFMMAMPFLLFGGLAFMMWNSIRRARRAQPPQLANPAFDSVGSQSLDD